jgi:hypothetical protein
MITLCLIVRQRLARAGHGSGLFGTRRHHPSSPI